MKAKALEVRDRATFVPVVAIDMNPDDFTPGVPDPDELYLLRRCGYPCDGEPNILLTRLDGSGKATTDPHEWGDRTFSAAHQYIIDKWIDLVHGTVIDVEYILGEAAEPKCSERVEFPL